MTTAKSTLQPLHHDMIQRSAVAQRELARVTLTHPPFPITLRIRDFGRSRFELEVLMTVPDTNSGIVINQPLVFECALPVSRQKFLRFVEVSIREAVLHELYESLHMDGKRIRDPHEGCGAGRAYTLVDDMRCFTRARSRVKASEVFR